MAPTLEADLDSSWSARVTGFYGTDKTYGVTQNFTNGAAPLSIRIFDNRSLSVEAGVEGPIFALPAGDVRLAAGGGYISGQAAGANFLTTSGQVTGLTAANDSGGGSGYSGILFWDNTGGQNSVITGVYPSRDNLIADPPTWLTAVPGTFSVDGRLPASGFFGSGLWPNFGASGAAGSAVIAHGTNTAGTSRLAVFANNPLYRADPEREWPMVGTAAYWADR